MQARACWPIDPFQLEQIPVRTGKDTVGSSPAFPFNGLHFPEQGSGLSRIRKDSRFKGYFDILSLIPKRFSI